MKIFGYGEDALTLWALKNKLSIILELLDDSSSISKCKAFFRPSFGRSGGAGSSQFGEFDFILLSEKKLYLGESKWHRSSENISNGILELRKEQLLRHTMFRFYVEEWAFGNHSTWVEFSKYAKEKLVSQGIYKSIPSDERLLATNLKTVLSAVKLQFDSLPAIKNVLLFLHDGSYTKSLPKQAGSDFEVVTIAYSESALKNFVVL
jgi:hypothetical protein